MQKEEAKRRDHRRLGQDLNLFSIQVWIYSHFMLLLS
jgi:threonyl-tRNA synthetase